MQFNMNLACADRENKDLVQEISAKSAIIQNMTNMIEKLEKQTVNAVRHSSYYRTLLSKFNIFFIQTSFEVVSVQRNEQQQHARNESSMMNTSQYNNGNGLKIYELVKQFFQILSSFILTEFVTQLNAAREQNIQLLEDVSNKISTIKRLESESSKLQHQLVRISFSFY